MTAWAPELRWATAGRLQLSCKTTVAEDMDYLVMG